jgi:polyisoprenoid-binding protein YceI
LLVASAPADGASASISLLANGSEARYRAQEQLVGQSLPNVAVGSTSDVTGSIVLEAGSSLVPEQSKIVVDLRSLRSGDSRRDNFIQGNTLQTQQFPTAEFVPTEARGAPATLPPAGEATFQLLGDLTVHGVKRPVVWDVTARFDGPTVTGQATTQVKLTDFGMTPPRVGPVLSLDDLVTLELAFQGAISASSAQTSSPGPARPTLHI